MDVFVIICLMSVFAALCEFAILNFITITMNRLKEKDKEQKESEEKAKELIEKAEKVIEALDDLKSSDDPPMIIVQVQKFCPKKSKNLLKV